MRTEVLGNEHLLRFIQLHAKGFFLLKLELGAYEKYYFVKKLKFTQMEYIAFLSFEIYENLEYCREKSYACN